jgi:hypothetical protein
MSGSPPVGNATRAPDVVARVTRRGGAKAECLGRNGRYSGRFRWYRRILVPGGTALAFRPTGLVLDLPLAGRDDFQHRAVEKEPEYSYQDEEVEEF